MTVSAFGFTSVTSIVTVENIDVENQIDRLPTPKTTDAYWTIRRNADYLVIIDATNQTIYNKLLSSVSGLVIDASEPLAHELAIDFSYGAFMLENGIAFNGSDEKAMKIGICYILSVPMATIPRQSMGRKINSMNFRFSRTTLFTTSHWTAKADMTTLLLRATNTLMISFLKTIISI
ncbi:MAG: hypothetical protein LBT05_13255 [Planctomycetaceae bacterium]|nr:hypothetical protein [Planctomycetaceae bacterium]